MENIKQFKTTRCLLPPLASRVFFIRSKASLRKSSYNQPIDISNRLLTSQSKNQSMSPMKNHSMSPVKNHSISPVKNHSISPSKRQISLSPEKVRSSFISENNLRLISFQPKCPWTLEQIQFGKVLGRGKLGRVLQAKIDFLDIAVKIIPQELKKYANIEIEILSLFSNPLIVSTYGDLEDKDSVYILLEHISCGDLFHKMRKRRMRQNEIVFYAAELVVILDLVHSKNVVYRDLKPENVMICETGHLKLIDFGLSKILDEDRTFTVCGSPEYMAPELLSKQGYSYSVDFWSLGVLIYELYSG